MSTQPVSVRFTDAEIELLDAARATMKASRGFDHSRADVLRTALKKVLPPDGRGPEVERWRRAYSAVFSKDQP
jgi:hypothetical protein